MGEKTLDSIRQFIESYTAAFDSADSERIADCYHVPCMTLRMDGSFHLFQSLREISDFFAKVVQAYRAEDMVRYRVARLEARKMGALAAAATVHWEGLRAGHHGVVRSWSQTYNLRFADGRWTIVLNINHVPDQKP